MSILETEKILPRSSEDFPDGFGSFGSKLWSEVWPCGRRSLPSPEFCEPKSSTGSSPTMGSSRTALTKLTFLVCLLELELITSIK